MAAVPSIFAFFFVSHFLLLHSAGEENAYMHCPESFHCGHLGQIKFPYTNTSYPNCGLCTVNCSESVPKLNLGMYNPIWYEVRGKFLDHDVPNDLPKKNYVLNVTDTVLRRLIKSNSCDVFSFWSLNWTFPTTRSVSFTVSPNLTLFKCPTVGGQHDGTTDDFFRRNNSYNGSYKGCSGYTVYYKYPPDYHQVLPKNGSFPKDCFVIQLPVVSPMALRNRNASNLFSILDSEFSLGFHVSNECLECHLDGGLCGRYYNTSKFQCIKAKEGGKYWKLILGIAIPGGSILLLCLLVLIIQLRKKRNYRSSYISSRDTFSNPSLKADVEGGSLYFGAPVFSYTELEEATHNFDPTKELGDGGFGTVYHGKKFRSFEYQSQR